MPSIRQCLDAVTAGCEGLSLGAVAEQTAGCVAGTAPASYDPVGDMTISQAEPSLAPGLDLGSP